MFSKGTFSRYLFEIDSSQSSIIETYRKMAENLEDEAIKKTLQHFVAQIEIEQEVLKNIRTAMQAAV